MDFGRQSGFRNPQNRPMRNLKDELACTKSGGMASRFVPVMFSLALAKPSKDRAFNPRRGFTLGAEPTPDKGPPEIRRFRKRSAAIVLSEAGRCR